MGKVHKWRRWRAEMARVLIIGDTHAPFAHEHALDFLSDLKRRYRPQVVVHIGDLGDQHGWSRHPRKPDAPGQADEDRLTLEWCRRLYRLFPRVKACIGNHDVRVAKAAEKAGLPSRFAVGLREIYESPDGWEWSDGFLIDHVAYMHGDGYSGADCAIKAAKDNRVSTVVGHVHSVGGVRHLASQFSRVFGLSTGCLVDPTSIGMAYAKKAPARPVLGSAVVIDGMPIFVPMEV